MLIVGFVIKKANKYTLMVKEAHDNRRGNPVWLFASLTEAPLAQGTDTAGDDDESWLYR